MIYLMSQDLMFSSQVTGAARQAGVVVQSLSNQAPLPDTSENPIVILDLAQSGGDAGQAVAELVKQGARVIAVAPHVHEEKLRAASESGAYRTLTRGQAHREMASLLQELASSDSSATGK